MTLSQTDSFIGIITDFGHKDPYVGIMKGVLLSVSATVRPVDLTHEIPPGDISAAAFWLERSRDAFPQGTTFLAVVDPTVGTKRRALAARVFGQTFVAPDNGLLEDVFAAAQEQEAPIDVFAIDPHRLDPRPMPPRGHTFHGRDLFAPAAAHLARGAHAQDLGSRLSLSQCIRKRWELPFEHSLMVAGEPATVRVVDHFGNVLTDFFWDTDEDPKVLLGGTRLPWVRTYEEAPDERLVALRGSFNTVELAMKRESAWNYLSST